MKIKIAPSIDEITRNENVLSCDFNNMQGPFILNSNMPFKSEFYVDGEKIEDPCTR